MTPITLSFFLSFYLSIFLLTWARFCVPLGNQKERFFMNLKLPINYIMRWNHKIINFNDQRDFPFSFLFFNIDLIILTFFSHPSCLFVFFFFSTLDEMFPFLHHNQTFLRLKKQYLNIISNPPILTFKSDRQTHFYCYYIMWSLPYIYLKILQRWLIIKAKAKPKPPLIMAFFYFLSFQFWKSSFKYSSVLANIDHIIIYARTFVVSFFFKNKIWWGAIYGCSTWLAN